MKEYIEKWSWKRIIQVIVGIYFIWNYIEDGMLFSLIFGGMMAFQAILNVGCFSTKGCAVPVNNNQDYSDNDEVDFEEVN